MVDSGRVIAQAEALLRRTSPEGRRLAARGRQRRWRSLVRRVARAMFAVLAIGFAGALFGLTVTPLGIEGLLLTLVMMAVAGGAILFWPAAPAPSPAALGRAELAALPLRAEEWLERQRPALPAPAARLIDQIGLGLETLAPQLQTLDAREPAAAEIRKLIADELPALVDGYRRVPTRLRGETGNGTSPDRQLVDGLEVVRGELARMSEQLASGDLHRLATQGRYLELKYRGDPG
jgi:hypothetical protein